MEGRLDRGRLGLIAAALTLLTCVGLLAAHLAVAQSAPAGSSAGDLTQDPKYKAGAKRGNERRQRLEGPESKRRRQESRTKFRNLPKSQALSLARDEFAAELRGRLPDGEEPALGLKVLRRFGAGTAVVRDEITGERTLLHTTYPLVVGERGGSTEPLDLSLADIGDDFVPRAAEQPVRIADGSEAEISLPEAGFSVRLESPRAADAQAIDDRVFYANTDTDTDAVVKPGPFGAELFVHLRSAESPESYELDVDLPQGAVLRRAQSSKPIPGDPPKSFEVVRGDETLGYIYPPNAYDADGVPIPSSMELAEGKIRLSVEHRGLDIRYPALVDPEVIQWGRGGANYGDWVNWFWRQNTKGGGAGFGAARNDPAYYYGLYQSMPTNSGFYSGAYAQWFFRAPPSTFLYRIVFGNVAHNPYYSGVYQGMADPGNTYWMGGVDKFNQYGDYAGNPGGPWGHGYSNINEDFCFQPRCGPHSWIPEHNTGVFGLEVAQVGGGVVGTGPSNKATNTMGWADMYLGDRTRPSTPRIYSGPTDGAWFDDRSADQTLSTDSYDAGLGMWALTLNGASSGGGSKYANCSYGGGNLTHACPRDFGASWTYRLREGENNLSVSAQDIVSNDSSSAATFTRRVDRSVPRTPTVSGNLYDDRLASRPDGGGLFRERHDLAVRGEDMYSGVSSVQMLVDEVQRKPADIIYNSGCSPASCPKTLSAAFSLRPSELSPGQHTVTVVVRDALEGSPGVDPARHTTRRSWTVWVPEDRVTIDDADGGEAPPEGYPDEPDSLVCPDTPESSSPDDCTPNETDPNTAAIRSEQRADSPILSPLIVGDLPATGSVTSTPRQAPASPTTLCDLRGPVSAPQSTTSTSRYGLSDEKGLNGEDFRSYPLGRSLGVKHVRLIIAYDLIPAAASAQAGQSACNDFHNVYDWVVRQLNEGAEPMLSVSKARSQQGAGTPPDVTPYRDAMRALMDKFPAVKVYTAWNEPNYTYQPTLNTPELAGKYWRAANGLCRVSSRRCQVGAGDFSDVINGANKGLKTSYLNAYYKGMGSRPPVFWAVHTYQTIVRRKYGRLERFLDWGPVRRSGQVWITEAAVYRWRRNNTSFTEQQGADQLRAFFAADAFRGNLSKIKRFYYYSLRSDGMGREDPALLEPNGQTPRQVYCVYKAKVSPGAACP